MIIDCHGHYTTAPKQHQGWREQQIAALDDHANVPPRPNISDDEIRETIENAQLKLQQRARHRPHDLLAARGRHGASHRQRRDQRGLGARSATT